MKFATTALRVQNPDIRVFNITVLILSLLVIGCSGSSSDPVAPAAAGTGGTDSGTGTGTDSGTGTGTGNGSGTGNTDSGTDPGAPDLTAAARQAGLRINEIVASNQLGLADEDGDTSDWIELYNPSDQALDLSGWHLSDDAEALDKWAFPALSVPAGGFVVVFASDKDRAAAGAELHTNFKLSAAGEYLGLSGPNASVVVDEFAPSYPELMEDQAYGVLGDGTLGVLSEPTPGAANPEQ